ncbi:MAG: class I SAM-dependent methyltransferase, partial [Planctomycetota bacterium]
AVLRELLPGHAVLHRFARTARNAEGFPEDDPGAEGDEVEPRYIREFDAEFLVHPGMSHKTGWFCDQRDNRQRLAQLVKGRDLLDLCCHAGGFAIPAMLGGARSVTAIDLDEEPLARAREAAARAGLDIEFHHDDAFNVLREVNQSRRRPGAVILDPHKLAKGKRDLEQAKGKYRDLNALGIGAVAPGGIVATFSCSGALDLPSFAGIVFQAARRAERDVRLIEVLGASADHPQRPDFGRSRYLKGLVLAVD